MKEDDELSGEAKFLNGATQILGAIVFLSLFGWLMLSRNASTFWAALLILIAIEIVDLWLYLKAADYGDFIFEGANFLVFLSVCYYYFTAPHPSNFLLLLTTYFYRASYLRQDSRLFVAVVSILILLTVIPVTSRIVEDDVLVVFFLGFYTILVGSLWCSKFLKWYTRI